MAGIQREDVNTKTYRERGRKFFRKKFCKNLQNQKFPRNGSAKKEIWILQRNQNTYGKLQIAKILKDQQSISYKILNIPWKY